MLVFFVSIYLLLTVLLGIVAAKRVVLAEDFILAGRKLPFHLSLASFFATWFGAETILGASSQFAQHGFKGIIEDPLGASFCLVITGLFFVKHLYSKGYLSIGDFFRDKYGPRFELIASLIQALSYFTYTAAQFVALGLVLQTITHFPFSICLSGGALFVITYTFFGGMWAIAITDMVQTVVIITGLVILAGYLYYICADTVSFTSLFQHTASGFFPEKNFNDYASFLTAWLVMGFGSIPSQDIFQRILSAKSEKVARQSAICSGVLYLTIAALPIFIVMLSLRLFGSSIAGGDYQQIIPHMVMTHMPLAIQALFFGALVSAILSTASASLLAQATVIGENLIKPSIRHFNDSQFLVLLRLLVVGVALVSICIGWNSSSIFSLVSGSSSFVLVSLFVPMVAGIWSTQPNTNAAFSSLTIGLFVYCLGLWWGMELLAVFWGLVMSAIGYLLGEFRFKKTNLSTRQS